MGGGDTIIWTPELKRLLEHHAEFEVKNKLIGLDRDEPTAISVLRIAFRVVAENGLNGRSSYKKICAAMGVDSEGKYSNNTRKMIGLAESHERPDIAKQLWQALYVSEEAARLYPLNDDESAFKTSITGVAKVIGGIAREAAGDLSFLKGLIEAEN